MNQNMSIRVSEQSYGKSMVRFTKVVRKGDWHELVECDASLKLSGQFDETYITGDNCQVIPTDTVKNTIYAFALKQDWVDIETFAKQLTEHFLGSFEHVSQAVAKLRQVTWQRIAVAGEPHSHSFVRGPDELAVCSVVQSRDQLTTCSGLVGLQVLKTTASAFEGYVVDQYTTLAPATDRIFATTIDAHWNWRSAPVDCDAIRSKIRQTILEVFATEFSPSVQNTLYKIGEQVLSDHAALADISLAMPNQHRLLVDMSRMNLENKNIVFCPTDEPYGDITATISRDDQ